jgi:hypothetical protein
MENWPASLAWGSGMTAVAALLSAGPASALAQPRTGIPVATISFAENAVESAAGGERWSRIQEGYRLKTGEQVRTTKGALARIEFPWMKLLLSSSSELAIPAGLVLSLDLKQGRVEILSEGDIIKLFSHEAEVRGQGRAVVRQVGTTTVVATIDGQFRVQAAGQAVSLKSNQGTIVASGSPPTMAEPLPQPPEELDPGADPFYAEKGKPITLSWMPSEGAYRIQVLPIDSDEVLIDKDVGGSPQSVAIPWLGTFRWRVAARDARGLEGVPSGEGLVCVVER